MSSIADSPSPIVDSPASAIWVTVADLCGQMGGVPAERIRLIPTPGTATERDVLELMDHQDRLCELVDGVLVEKTMGYMESVLAMAIGEFLRRFVRKHNLGVVSGEAGMLNMLPGQVRIPDVAFVSRDRLPDGKLPKTPIPAIVPDLAVEILSKGNTEAEMRRKLQDYFAAGVRLVWYIDPRDRTAAVYTSTEQCTMLDHSGVLDGGDVLPGFELPLRELFAEIEESPS